MRAVSRSDVPVFTCESVNMGQPAYGKKTTLSYLNDTNENFD